MLTFDIRAYRTAARVRSAARSTTRDPHALTPGMSTKIVREISVDKAARGFYFLIFLATAILVCTLPS
jgi:hypothetical protein